MPEHSVEMTLQVATAAFLKRLEANGKSPRTIYTYGKDCEQMIAFFGPEKKLVNILPAHVGRFYKSDVLLKIPRKGKDRAEKTVKKTKMVFRLFLTWAKEVGYIENLPLPKIVSSY